MTVRERPRLIRGWFYSMNGDWRVTTSDPDVSSGSLVKVKRRGDNGLAVVRLGGILWRNPVSGETLYSAVEEDGEGL